VAVAVVDRFGVPQPGDIGNRSYPRHG
jgi:hypothetical protein